MASKDEFAYYCAELLTPLGTVRVRRMFGGHGLYIDELFVAIVTGETLYLKADTESAPAFEGAGGRPFSYQARGRGRTSLGFWTPPAEAMDSPGLMAPWGRLAVGAALRARAGKPKARRSH